MDLRYREKVLETSDLDIIGCSNESSQVNQVESAVSVPNESSSDNTIGRSTINSDSVNTANDENAVYYDSVKSESTISPVAPRLSTRTRGLPEWYLSGVYELAHKPITCTWYYV